MGWVSFIIHVIPLSSLLVTLAVISVTSTCLAFSPAVYKKLWFTLLEYSLHFNLSSVSVATFYCRDPQFSGNQAVVSWHCPHNICYLLPTSTSALSIHKPGRLFQKSYSEEHWCMVNWWILQQRVQMKRSSNQLWQKIWLVVLQFNEICEPVLFMITRTTIELITVIMVLQFYFNWHAL